MWDYGISKRDLACRVPAPPLARINRSIVRIRYLYVYAGRVRNPIIREEAVALNGKRAKGEKKRKMLISKPSAEQLPSQLSAPPDTNARTAAPPPVRAALHGIRRA